MLNLFNEVEWKPLVRFQKVVPGYYVSYDGRAYSAKTGTLMTPVKNIRRRRTDDADIIKEISFKCYISKDLFDDYEYAKHQGRETNKVYVRVPYHRAVMETWKPIDEFPPDSLKGCWDTLPEAAKQWVRDTAIIDHIDGDPTNNHVDNLRWCTPKENQPHRKEQTFNGIKGLVELNKLQ